jgi:two-component system response regulator FlrC
MIVEDDQALREALDDTLELAGYRSITADSGESALLMLDTEHPDMIISDVNMPGINGLSFLKSLNNKLPEVPVLLMTAYGNISDAVQAMKEGAVDYLSKPFEPNFLIEKLKRFMPVTVRDNEPVAADPRTKQLLAMAKKVAKSDVSVMISGASGTGKEVLAHYIHDMSSRKDHEFIAINCAAIPESMLEATLFGYEKGAFTGALKSLPGKFEQAQNGTILLDEISEMDLALQAKLLRVLQEREVERIGGSKMIPLNVRVLATTNRDLKEEVAANRFREDLYYRLNVFPLHWMPLKDRPMDIAPLAYYLLERHAKTMGRSTPLLTEAAISYLQQYDWPGNAREMDNIMQRALVMQSGDTIDVEDVQFDLSMDQYADVTGERS